MRNLRKIKQPLQKRNRYSDYKDWCSRNRIPMVVFPILCGFLFALLCLCIGGAIAGWHILRTLTSKTAILIYVLLILVAIYTAFTIFKKYDRR